MSLSKLWLIGAYVGPLGIIGIIWYFGSTGAIPVVPEVEPLRPYAWPLAALIVVVGATMTAAMRWYVLRPAYLANLTLPAGKDGPADRARVGLSVILGAIDSPVILVAVFAVIVDRHELIGLALAYALIAATVARPDFDRLLTLAGGTVAPVTAAGPVGAGDKRVNPKLWLALVAAIAVVAFVKVSNPHRVYSSSAYWRTATVESVAEIPDEALAPGNRNGSVLMWAAIASPDPRVIEALVARGADVNESDPWFDGTPLTGAAGKSEHPEMIDVLVRLGADVNKRVNNGEDALMVAARFNRTPGIAERLLAHGANPRARNAQGKTALDLANDADNTVVAKALREWAP